MMKNDDSNNDMLTSIRKKAYFGTGISLIVVGVLYFILFDLLKIAETQRILGYIIPIVVVCCGFLYLFILKFNSLTFLACCFSVLTIGVLNCSPTIKLSLTYLVPIILSFYTLDRKIIIHTAAFDVLVVFVSSFIRFTNYSVYLNYVSSISGNESKLAFLVIFAFSCEFIIITVLFYPYHRYIISLRKDRETFKKDNEILLEEKNIGLVSVIKFCTTAMTYHSKYLLVHNENVKNITDVLLQDLCQKEEYKDYLTPEKCNDILFSVQFHDIGKIYVDSIVLDKPSALTKEEYSLVKEHPIKGKELFDTLPLSVTTPSFRSTCEKIIMEHHERLDGTGYPCGLTDISLEGQIIAVSDVTDALLSWRCYKKPFEWKEFSEILFGNSGLNQEMCEIIIKNRKAIQKIISNSNLVLQRIFNLSQKDF